MISGNFPHIAQSVSAHQTVEITGEVYIGDNCQLAEHVTLLASNGRLIIGESTSIGANSKIYSENKRTEIGERVSIGKNCIIGCEIGDNSIIADNILLDVSVVVGSNCNIESNQKLKEMNIPDNSTVREGQIVSNN